jgi:hypothetical protein
MQELYGVEVRMISWEHLWTHFCGDAGAFISRRKGASLPTCFVDVPGTGTEQAIRGDGATS